jgi:hypothetical protein
MRTIKVQHEGQECEAEELDWEVATGEGWSQYTLADGTSLKVKTVLHKVVRLIGKRNQLGEPIYLVFTQNIVTAHVQQHMMMSHN